MNIFNFRSTFFLILLSLSLTMAGFLFFSHKKDRQDFLTRKSYFIFAEAQTFFVAFNTGLTDTLKKYLFLLDLRQKNFALQEENQELQIKQQLFEKTLIENKKLKEIIDFSENQKLDLLAGQVIGRDFFSNNQMLFINKGSSHGVKQFMGVLHPQGVVGYIFKTSPHSSQVITITHPLSSLPVRNRASRQTGLLTGSTKGLSLNIWEKAGYFDDISKNFKAEDILITMESRSFPDGFLVGQILPFLKSSTGSAPEIPVKPFINFKGLEEVFILLNSFSDYKKNMDKIQQINGNTN